MLLSLAVSYALATGVVKLTVNDAPGKPVVNRQIWLVPTESTKNVRPFGVHWRVPDTAPIHTGTTDKAGKVSIRGVQKEKPMMVIMRFGPRFDAFVMKDSHRSPDSPSMDVMKFEGAVYAEKPAQILLANDYEIGGRVTDRDSGKPIAGFAVNLCDTMAGHMSGYPLTVIDQVTTGLDGRYTFSNLPNCYYSLEMGRVGPLVGIESKFGNDQWKVDGVSQQEKGFAEMTVQPEVLLNKPKAHVDFRVSRVAELTVDIKKGLAKSLRGWILTVEFRGAGFSRELDWASMSSKRSPSKSEEVITQTLVPGTYSILLERKSDHATFVAKTIQLKSGEHKRIDLTLSTALASKRRPNGNL